MHDEFCSGALGYAAAFSLSLLGCWAIIFHPGLAKRTAGHFADTYATQAMHSKPTPRVGGIVVILSFAICLGVFGQQVPYDLAIALVAGIVVFIAGAIEDVARNVSPRLRLFAAFASAAIAALMSGATVRGFGVADIDLIFALPAVALVITLIWSAGYCHALNLIDGLNGLASSYAMVASLGLAVIAHTVGSADIQFASLLLVAAMAGFFVFNWPLGKIFFGDAGAYMVGHILAWFGILLMTRSSELSAFAILLIFFWPVMDTALAIIRRKLNRHPTDRPDRLHFHHLVARSLGLVLRHRKSRGAFNALSTIVILPLFTMPVIFGVMLWNQPARALVVLLVFTILFIGTYAAGCDFIANRRFQERRSASRRILKMERSVVSKLSGVYIAESLSVDVRIEKYAHSHTWALKTLAHNAEGRVWAEEFESDLDAWEAFISAVENGGMDAVIGRPIRSRSTSDE